MKTRRCSAFWSEVAPALWSLKQQPGSTQRTVARHLRWQISRGANDLGVFLERREGPDLARWAYQAARSANPRNLNAVVNLSGLDGDRDLQKVVPPGRSEAWSLVVVLDARLQDRSQQQREEYRDLRAAVGLPNSRRVRGNCCCVRFPCSYIDRAMTRTLFEKIWDRHAVSELGGGTVLLYIDRHLVHEVTSAQAFEGLRMSGRKVRRRDLTFATMDHNIPTTADRMTIRDPISKAQVDALEVNCREFDILLYGMGHPHQGIVHVIGPELGLTLPGLTLVCGDSHTSTHGAFGSLAFGIGTSEVEHVLATQTLRQKRPKTMRVTFTGRLQPWATSKDMILKLIGTIGTAGGTGYVIEYAGEAVRALSMDARMTMCNMSIEAGARAGMVAPDDTTFEYIAERDRPFVPKGADFDRMVEFWRTLPSDEDAVFDRELTIDASAISPQVTWGTNPGMVTDVTGRVPDVDEVPGCSPSDVRHALEYMGLKPGTAITDIPIDTVFLGSCTNSRMEDLQRAARILKGRKVAPDVRLLVVPGSHQVRREAEREGLDRIFTEAGGEWRHAGCSMCLGMNPDQLKPGERSASTSNRNFEGRQGKGGRTHLVSPEMAAAAAVEGHFVDIRAWMKEHERETV